MGRPKIIVLVASTADGRIAVSPNRTMWEEMDDPRNQTEGGDEVWQTVENHLNTLHSPEADMLGSNSLAKEGESPKELPSFDGPTESLYHDFLPEEVVNAPNWKGWLVVVDGRGRVRSGYRGDVANGKFMLHLVSRGVAPDYLHFLQTNNIPYLVTGEKRVDLPLAMEKLHTKLGVKSLITTSGGKLAGGLIRENMIDEVNIIVKPLLFGGEETPALFAAPDLKSNEFPEKLRLISSTTEANGHIWLRYKVIK